MRFVKNLLPFAGLLLLGTLAYANSLHGPLVFDDLAAIRANDSIRSVEPMHFFAAGHTRPVLMFSFALNHALGGLDTFGYHLTNIAIHLVASCVLFALLRRVFSNARVLSDRAAAQPLAWLVAAIWLVHPLQTESVTYIVQRAESLMGLCYLSVLYCLVRGTTTTSSAWTWYAAAVALTWLGMGVKEAMVTVPAVAALTDRMLLADSWREVAIRRWGTYVGMVIALGSYEWMLRPIFTGDAASAGFGQQGHSAWEHLLSAPQVILLYLRLALWPWPQCFDYHLAHVETLPEAALPGLAITAVLVAALVAGHRQRTWALPVLVFFILLSPTTSFVPLVDIAAEHRMYLPLAPLVALVVVGIHKARTSVSSQLNSPHWVRTVSAAMAIVVLMTLTLATRQRNLIYRSPVALWRSVVDVRPANFHARNNLAVALTDTGYPAEARAQLTEVRRLAPSSFQAGIDFNEARAWMREYRPEMAYDSAAAAVHAQPDELPYQLLLGEVCLATGRTRRAEAIFRHLIQLQPDANAWRAKIAEALLVLGQPREALEHLRLALQRQPESATIHGLLAETYQQLGDAEQADTSLAQMRRWSRSPDKVLYAEARVMSLRGELAAAERTLQPLVERYPRDVEILVTLLDVLLRQNRTDEAAAAATRVRQLQQERVDSQRRLAGELKSVREADSPQARAADRLAKQLESAP